VGLAMGFFESELCKAAINHDHTKLSGIDQFHADFQTNFKQTSWWDNHRKEERHHLGNPDGVPEDVNLVDVLEYISDCVMAGKARSGKVYDIDINESVLWMAFKNTCQMLEKEVVVVDNKK
jgi:hypothetical protein